MDLDGRGGVEEPGGIVGRETNQNTLYGKKNLCFLSLRNIYWLFFFFGLENLIDEYSAF